MAPGRKPKTRATYHHGNLREALVAAALEVIDEKGVEALSVREVARRAGVSSGAPFRHFADKPALMAAVAEEALSRFIDVTEAAVARAGDDPVDRFQAQGVAFVRFAVDHPAHFRVMFSAALSRVESEELTRLREATGGRLRELVVAGQQAGRLREGEPEPIMLSAHALVYGLARMYVDGLIDELGLGDVPPEDVARMVTGWLGRGIERE